MDGPATSRLRGVLLGLAATAAWSLSGIMVRLVPELDPWQIILFRSLGVVIAIGMTLSFGRRLRLAAVLRQAGWPAVLAGAFSAASSVLFILSLQHVTVANALFMSGIAPFITAIGAWLLLSEPITLRTWGAMFLGAAGVSVMLGQGLSGEGLWGNVLALGMAATFAAYSLMLRQGRSGDMLPAVLWSGILNLCLSLVVVIAGLGVAGLAPGAFPMTLCIGMGTVQLGLGMALYTRASRDLPAAQLQLVATMELVLSPLWVWLGVGETPTMMTLLGGGLIMLAVLSQVIGRQARQPVSA
jgi:DME family drug/metabolite transporter